MQPTVRHYVLVLALLAAGAPAVARAQVVQEHVAGLRGPMKLLALPSGQLLVAEAGNGPNTGRVSLVDRDARRFTVIDGLPSALFLGRDPSGPSGLVLDGRRLYVLIGGGDTTIAGAGTGSEIPNPSPSSPLLSSVLLLEFPDAANNLSLGYALPVAAHARLAAGEGVYLSNSDGEAVRVSLLVDFPNTTPEPRPDEPRHVRTSNPFGMVGNSAGLAVVDASNNALWQVPIAPGTAPSRLANFPPVPNRLFPGLGPPVSEAVPASIRVWGDDFVVSFLTGFPFGAGNARVVSVKRRTGEVSPVAADLQTAIDVLPLQGASGVFHVLEYSQNFLAGGTGRLLRVDTTRGTRLTMADGLRTPTSLATDTRTGDLFVTELAGGRVLRVLVPR